MSDSKKTYQALEQELSTILERIERASYEDLDELLKDHAASTAIITELQKRLDTASVEIKKITHTHEITEP